ncbi:hypothetical protein [Verminephrobacter aporrectodeae]|nr:hypothetical protein [Verminephrobacter aporrectodeae]
MIGQLVTRVQELESRLSKISPGTLHGWAREADALLSPSVQARSR